MDRIFIFYVFTVYGSFSVVAGKCDFTISTIYYTQLSAELRCHSGGSNIAMPRNQEEHNQLEDFLNSASSGSDEDVWIGLTLSSTSTDPTYFQWADKSFVSWTNWGPTDNEPNNLGFQKCVIMDGELRKWYTKPCSESHTAVCGGCNYGTTQGTSLASNGDDKSSSSVLLPSPPPKIDSSFFTRLVDTQPNGPQLLEVWTRSLARCASICLRTDSCDVIFGYPGGSCILYNSSDVVFQSQIHDWETYKRRNRP